MLNMVQWRNRNAPKPNIMIVEPGKTTQYDLMLSWVPQVGKPAILVSYSTDVTLEDASRQALANPALQIFRVVTMRTRVAPRLSKPK